MQTKPKEKSKLSRVIGIFVALYTLYNLLFAIIGLRVAAGGFAAAVMTILLLCFIGVAIGIISVTARRSRASTGARSASRADRAEAKFSVAAAKTAERGNLRPRAKTVQCAAGESHERTVGEDCFVLPPRNPAARRREQLETLYRAGLYTREEYAAEREKLRERYGSI